MLPQSQSWIQWAALDFAQLGLVSYSLKNTASSQLLRILWIPPKFLLGHFSIRPLLESWPRCSLYTSMVLKDTAALWTPVDRHTPQAKPFRVGVKLLAPAFVWSRSFHFDSSAEMPSLCNTKYLVWTYADSTTNTDAILISERAKFHWSMRKRHHWTFVSALWRLRLQSKPLNWNMED